VEKDKKKELEEILNSSGFGDNDGDDINSSWKISSSSGNPLVVSGGAGSWSTISNSSLFHDEDLTDIFIKIVKHLSEEDIIKMLDSIKESQHANYLRCLFNLLSYPNFKPMSEKFIIDRYEDLKSAEKKIRSMSINFELVYGEILDKMPSLKLLLQMKKDE
jgi:hypothetical protein